ncbi:hypothetical protein Tco_0190401 [Tanacetum coccineum]
MCTCFVLVILNPEFEVFQILRTEAQLAAKGYQTAAKKNSSASKTSSSAQNVAFVSQSKSSTNKVKSGFSGAYSSCTPSTSSTNIPEKEVLADLEQIDDVDIEEMDINWQIAMIAIRMKKFYKENKGRDSEMYQQRGHMRKEEERHNLSHQEAGTQEQNQMVADNRMMGFVNWG